MNGKPLRGRRPVGAPGWSTSLEGRRPVSPADKAARMERFVGLPVSLSIADLDDYGNKLTDRRWEVKGIVKAVKKVNGVYHVVMDKPRSLIRVARITFVVVTHGQ